MSGIVLESIANPVEFRHSEKHQKSPAKETHSQELPLINFQNNRIKKPSSQAKIIVKIKGTLFYKQSSQYQDIKTLVCRILNSTKEIKFMCCKKITGLSSKHFLKNIKKNDSEKVLWLP